LDIGNAVNAIAKALRHGATIQLALRDAPRLTLEAAYTITEENLELFKAETDGIMSKTLNGYLRYLVKFLDMSTGF